MASPLAVSGAVIVTAVVLLPAKRTTGEEKAARLVAVETRVQPA